MKSLTEREAHPLLRLASRLPTNGTLADPTVVVPASFVTEQQKRDLAALHEVREAAGQLGTGRSPVEGTFYGIPADLLLEDPVLASVKKLAEQYGWSEVETLTVMVLQLHAAGQRQREQAVNLLVRSPLPVGLTAEELALFIIPLPPQPVERESLARAKLLAEDFNRNQGTTKQRSSGTLTVPPAVNQEGVSS